MRRIVLRGCIGSIALVATLVVILLVVLQRNQLPEGVLPSGASDIQVHSTSWRLTEGSYQVSLTYDQLSDELHQQMEVRGWQSLVVAPTAGPSIFNPDPTPLVFQRRYWFGWMHELVRVKATSGPPTRVEVTVTRTVRWPSVVRWLWFRLRGL